MSAIALPPEAAGPTYVASTVNTKGMAYDQSFCAVEPESAAQFSFNTELNDSLNEAVRVLHVPRDKAMVWAVSLLCFAAKAKSEGKHLGLADNAEVLAEEIVGF